MSKKRWFRFYTDAWLTGTFGMTPNEIAAYVTVLCELYDREGIVIRPDFDIMSRRCGMRPSSFRKAFDVLVKRGKLSLDGDVLTSKAVSEEIKSREKLGENSAESREKLAEKRKIINAIHQKHGSNIEERIQTNSSTFKGSGFPLPPQGYGDVQEHPAVAAFAKRQQVRTRRL